MIFADHFHGICHTKKINEVRGNGMNVLVAGSKDGSGER